MLGHPADRRRLDSATQLTLSWVGELGVRTLLLHAKKSNVGDCWSSSAANDLSPFSLVTRYWLHVERLHREAHAMAGDDVRQPLAELRRREPAAAASDVEVRQLRGSNSDTNNESTTAEAEKSETNFRETRAEFIRFA